MKFGMTLFGTHPLTRSSQDNFRDIVELARAAERLGFDMVYAGQHYLVQRFQKFQPIPVLSRLSAYTGSMYINLTDLLPLNHPVRLAEELASMDVMTDGRVVLTAALGYAAHEFAAFGVAKGERLGRFLEAVEVIKQLWTQPESNFEGRFFRLAGASINPKPLQKPRPPIWMTADNSRGVIRTARSGDVWFMSDHNRVAELKELVALYEAHRTASPDDFNKIGFERPLLRTAFVAETRQEALEAARPYIEEYWRDYYGTMNHAAEMDVPEDFNQPFERLWRDRFLLADPVECVEEIHRYREELGADSVVFYLPVTLDRQIRAMELLSAKVFPRLR
jgi:alkanesulfonate monooxygenase SsuD/methylene tetrahydromethanopterin reductase-like flavin-dependent oxidoreductase (luciferase family)